MSPPPLSLARLRPPASFLGWHGGSCCARCAAIQQGRLSRPDRQSGPAALAGLVNGARLPRRRCGLLPVPPRSAARATGGALSSCSPYRRSPLPNPIPYRAGLSWGITSPGRLGGHPSSPSLVPLGYGGWSSTSTPRMPPYACRRTRGVDGRWTNGRSPHVTADRLAHLEALRAPWGVQTGPARHKRRPGTVRVPAAILGPFWHAQRSFGHRSEPTD
jgi:hypothetical protein